jgi:hypothetical protein
VQFLKKMAKILKDMILKVLKAIDQPIAEAKVTTRDRAGKELTSPLIETVVRRAVSAAIIVAGTALSAYASPESQVFSRVGDTFTRLINETWYGGFNERSV